MSRPTAGPTAHGWTATRWESYLHGRRAERGVLEVAQRSLGDAVVGELCDRVVGAADDAADAGDLAAVDALGDACTLAVDALGRGVFARLYADPEARESGPLWVRAGLRAVADEVTEDLRAACSGDPDMSAIGTAAIVDALRQQLGRVMDEIEQAGQDPSSDPSDEPAAGEGSPGAQDGAEGSGADEGAPGPGDLEAAIQAAAQAARGAVRAAALSAEAQVTRARESLNGLLPGLGSAPRAADQGDPRRLELVNQIRRDKRLQQVLRIAGRIERVADRVRRVPAVDAAVEVVDVERGADLSRVVPSELVGLRRPGALRLLALQRLADRTLLQRQTTGHERLGRGPICCLLDVSASMDAVLADGLERVAWAAAIGIATVRTGIEQRRDVSVCTFDGRVLQQWRVRRDDRAEAEHAILALARIRSAGGTSFDAALTWALDSGAERDRADVVLVTDGMDRVSANVLERLQASKARGLRVWGVLAGEGGVDGALREFVDGVTLVDGGTDASVQIGQAMGGVRP